MNLIRRFLRIAFGISDYSVCVLDLQTVGIEEELAKRFVSTLGAKEGYIIYAGIVRGEIDLEKANSIIQTRLDAISA